MRILSLLFISSILLYGCTSSEKNSNQENEYPNLVSLSSPGDQKQEESNVYIDNIETLRKDNQKELLISGSFPDACTHLKTATYSTSGDTLEITLEAWREPKIVCAQVLTSFSYIFKDIPKEILMKSPSAKINSRTYQIN